MSRGATRVLRLEDLPEGSLRMVRVADRRLCLVRTSTGVHAIDHACPHEGYGLTQGSLDGDLLTCAWHNWKFRVSDGACVQGEEDVPAHHTSVDDEGWVTVALDEPDPAQERRRLGASLRRGIERDYIGQVSRDVVRLLRASADPGELVWEAIAYGAPRAEFGWGHAVASASDCLAMVDLHDGDSRALPVVQAIAGIAESERGRSIRPLPDPARHLPAAPGTAFRRLVEAEDVSGAQALLLAGLEAGLGPSDVGPWFTSVVGDHHLSYGHGAIYAQKAFQLLERIGWDRASTVLPHLVPTLVHATREDLLPYMRPFMRALAGANLPRLAEIDAAPGWSDDGQLVDALLGRGRTAPVEAAVAALEEGAGVPGILDAVVACVSERLLRYDVSGERVLDDDFGWLDITHGITYANAARWHHAHNPGPETLRLALFCSVLAHWTGRHEWHTQVGPRWDGPVDGPVDGLRAATAEVSSNAGAGRQAELALQSACLEGRPADAVAAVGRLPIQRAGAALQRAALLDGTNTTILFAHAVKTSRAAAEEAVATGSALPLAATARFLAAPKLERFVAATVTRSIELLADRPRS